MIKLFLKFELSKVLKYFTTRTSAKIITTLLFLSVFYFVGSGIYFFFLSGFRYIIFESDEGVRNALLLFLYEVFLIIFSCIAIFGALISGLFSLYRGVNNNWIISSPGFTFFPKVIIFRSSMVTLLPALVMFVPAILAFNKVHHLGVFSLLLLSSSVIFLLIALTALTLLFTLSISNLYLVVTRNFFPNSFTFKGLILLISGIVVTVVFGLWKIIKSVDLVQLFKADTVTEVLTVTEIGKHFMFLPTHAFGMELLSLQAGQNMTAVFYTICLALIAFFAVGIWWKLSDTYYTAWQLFQDGVGNSSRTLKLSSMGYTFSGGPLLALFKKELLVSSRNWKAVLWFSFLTFLWFAQIATNSVVARTIQKYQPDLGDKTLLLQAIQFIIAIYFIAAFTLRFAFTSFSVEKRTMWILGSSPLSYNKIFFGKYIFYVITLLTLGITMSLLNLKVLHFPIVYGAYTLLTLTTSIVFIVTIGMILGALFPNTETDDPEAATTSMPGLLFTAFSLLYGSLCDYVLYTAIRDNHTYGLSVLIASSCAAIALMIYSAPKLLLRKASIEN
jgi:hypothetical protein